MVEDLYTMHQYSQLGWKNDAIENTLWLELLLPFTAVRNISTHLRDLRQGIAAALQEPTGPFRENIGQFDAARQLSGHPFTISDWSEEEESAFVNFSNLSIGRHGETGM
jgi:hypothetical protein